MASQNEPGKDPSPAPHAQNLRAPQDAPAKLDQPRDVPAAPVVFSDWASI